MAFKEHVDAPTRGVWCVTSSFNAVKSIPFFSDIFIPFRNRGGKGPSPISYWELVKLHNNCVKALALCKGTAKEPARNADLDTGMYGKYVKFQAPYKSRLEYLNKGQFEKPVAADGDKCLPRLLLKFDTKVQQGVQQPMDNTTYGVFSCAFDAERIAAYEEANVKFKTDMLLQGSISLPKLQNLVLMDLAYFHARHLKWEDKTPGHLVGATARSSDDDEPPPAPASAAAPISSAPKIDFMGWDITDMNSVPWDKLSFSLTGSETMKYGDVPQYIIPALCLASERMMRHAKEPKVMIDFFEECKTKIESAFGESMESFLSLSVTEAGKPKPPVEMKRPLRVADYSAKETEYINSVWDIAANTYQSINPTDERPEINEGQSEDITEVPRTRDLRSKDCAKPVQDSRAAPQPSPAIRSRVKQVATVKTPPVVDRGEPRLVSSDRGRSRGRGRKRGQDRIHGLTESARLEVPLSPATGRMLLGQVSLNFVFL